MMPLCLTIHPEPWLKYEDKLDPPGTIADRFLELAMHPAVDVQASPHPITAVCTGRSEAPAGRLRKFSAGSRIHTGVDMAVVLCT